jgi:hypothetical protein
MKGKEKSLRVKIGGEIVKSEGIPRGKLDRVMKFNSRELSPSEIGALKLWRTDMHEPSAPKNSNFSESTGLQVKNQPHLPSGKFWSTRKEGSFISGGLNDGFGNRRIPGKELKAESKEFWDEVYVSVGRPTKGSKIVEVNESLLHNLEYEGMTKSDITNYFKENGVDFVKIPSVELSGKLTEIIQLMPERVKVRGKRDGFYVVPIALISNVISSDKN